MFFYFFVQRLPFVYAYQQSSAVRSQNIFYISAFSYWIYTLVNGHHVRILDVSPNTYRVHAQTRLYPFMCVHMLTFRVYQRLFGGGSYRESPLTLSLWRSINSTILLRFDCLFSLESCRTRFFCPKRSDFLLQTPEYLIWRCMCSGQDRSYRPDTQITVDGH
jgi:hypothetical protein